MAEKIKLTVFTVLIIICMVAFTPGISLPGDNDGMDVVLVMDSSGSMKKTDPMSLRIPAAKLFISLLDKKDRASVVSFSDKGYPIIHLTPVDSEENKGLLLKAADKISSAGLFTNLYDALSTGLNILSEAENKERSRIIVLMSDGMMDVGNPDEDRALVEKIRNEMATALEDRGIKVYTIAFTEQSDRLLLEKTSKRTGGFYNLALTDKDLHVIFTSIFESLKRPDMLPLSNNGFLIDQSIEEVTIVATKGSPETRINLKAPDGQNYSNRGKTTGVSWFASDNFDMISVKNPSEGKWEILFSTGENNKAYIITNLKLQTNFDQLYSTFGDPLDIKIWLEKDGDIIKEQALLDKFDIYLELTGPDGKTSKLQPFNKGEGIFLRNVAPFTPGNYRMRIVAQGGTFEREKVFVFNVADARESKEDMLSKREKAKKPGMPALDKTSKNDLAGNIPWKKVILQFAAINLILTIIIMAYLKRKRLKVMIMRNDAPGTKIADMPGREQVEMEDGNDPELKGESEDLNHAVTSAERDDSKGPEDMPPPVPQNEQEVEKQEIPLEEAELESEKVEDQNIVQGTDAPEQNQETVHEEDNKEAKSGSDSLWADDFNRQEILNQEDLNDLLASGEEAAAGQGDRTSDENKEGTGKAGEATHAKENTEDTVQGNAQEDIDAIWQAALQEQEGKGSAPDITMEEKERPSQETNLQDNTGENIDDLWNEALQEQRTAGEKTGVPPLPDQKIERPENQSSGENIQDDRHDNIDDLWNEALQEQSRSENENKISEGHSEINTAERPQAHNEDLAEETGDRGG